ncbi:YdcH family protein [Pseudovibrio sp. Ad5]|uniref:YdcH family protein n=1 Tax=Pseudovibrio sp. Ad5 TaxID=989436 RepID=UPI00406CA62E
MVPSSTCNRDNVGGSKPMSIREHLTELERRHATIERELETAKHHPSMDEIELGNLKRQKLKLKDEISRIRVTG